MKDDKPCSYTSERLNHLEALIDARLSRIEDDVKKLLEAKGVLTQQAKSHAVLYSILISTAVGLAFKFGIS